MLVQLVGVCREDRSWDWFYTLDFEVNQAYRFELREAVRGVIRFEPLLTIGQAHHLMGRLKRNCVSQVDEKKVRNEMLAGAKELGMGQSFGHLLRFVKGPYNRINQASTSSRAPLDNRVLDQMIRILAGRSLLSEEVMSLMEASGLGAWKADWKRFVQAGVCKGMLQLVPGMEMKVVRSIFGSRVELRCKRCGSTGDSLVWTECPACGGPCPYCKECLTMGRVRPCSLLVRGAGVGVVALKREPSDRFELSSWGLSPAQEAASTEGLRFLEGQGGSLDSGAPQRFLIWAVTGAGKTEMIFPLVDHTLKRGGKVLITTPRRDVVLELKPRIAKAFEEAKVVALYGGSEDRWEPGDITLATTHQLMRFYQAFDVVIIDELDAFPYHNNPMLEFAARQVCTPGGRYVLLSATPPKAMQKEVMRGRLPHVKVPVRFHRNPLPVPVRLAIPELSKVVTRGHLPVALMRAMKRSVDRGAQVFIFVPKIALVEPIVKLLRRQFPGMAVAGTSSHDEERSEKVVDFRGKEIQILVTTTILERGVTVPKSDVFILGAESALFDEASLVQMSGRAGRSKDDPNGFVYFASRDWTAAQAGAISQIRGMNKVAKEKGYLIGQGAGVDKEKGLKGGLARVVRKMMTKGGSS